MPGRKLAVSLRASLPDDQIGRLRAGFVVLTVLFGVTQAGAAFAAPPSERPFAVGSLCALVTPAVIGAQAAEPGDLIGQIITLFVLSSILYKLRTSSLARDDLQRALTHQAHYDALTGLPNRHLFHQLLDRAVARYRSAGVPYALFVMDLDGFKRVNDTYGHDQGDRLLAEVGRRVAATVRKGDHCARLGGDEFAVLLEDCEREDAERLAERLVAEIERPVELDGAVGTVGASIGVTWSGEDADAALRDADRAMYAVKLAAGARR